MYMERERLGSRLGFIMLSAGCAIGCGNVWKFPWMCGQNGGGSFMLVYIICLIIMGIPVMTMEFSIGRAAQCSAVNMYKKLQKPNGKWGFMGYVCVIGNVALMAFYTVVTGWLIYYFVKFLTNNQKNFGYEKMIADPKINVIYLLVTVILAFSVLCFKLQGGLERVTKYMMIALLLIILILAGRSITLPGAKEGLEFYLIPDFSKINGSVIVGAMNQSFFTLSVGMGSMAIFGSYIDKERSLMSESISIIVIDSFVAIAAGLIMFPACFSYGLEVNAGPSLLFDTMASVFNNMEGGRWWGTVFFLFMVFAAMSTVLGVCENIIAMFRDITGFGRVKSSIICGFIVFTLALTTALGNSVWKFHPFGKGSTWLDFWDFIVSTNILPLGSLVIALFCCNSFGWGWESFMKEANEGKGIKIKQWMKPVFRFVVPIGIAIIYIYGIKG